MNYFEKQNPIDNHSQKFLEESGLLVAMSRMQCELPRVGALALTLGLKLASLETRSSAPDVPMALTSNPDSGRNFFINAKKRRSPNGKCLLSYFKFNFLFQEIFQLFRSAWVAKFT